MIKGWYYLHVNGDLIYKRDLGGQAADIRESDFARSMWPFVAEDREGAWRIVIEAAALGAKPERIQELADIWGCDDKDADIYAARVGVNLFMDGDMWCATDMHFVDLASSPAGFGATKREAMANLCKALGFRGGKMWNATFADLLQKRQFGVGA